VREVVRLLLSATDQVVKATGLQFRAVMQPDQQMWFPPPHQKQLQVLGCCIGIDDYETLPKLKYCCSDAKEMAARFCSAEHTSRGVSFLKKFFYY